MVLELMEGGELFDQIRKKISFTEKEASEITKQVSDCILCGNICSVCKCLLQ